jgi:hypothetical protein
LFGVFGAFGGDFETLVISFQEKFWIGFHSAPLVA